MMTQVEKIGSSISMGRRLVLLILTAAAAVSCSTVPRVPGPRQLASSGQAHRYKFRASIDRDRALKIMAGYPPLHAQYEQSRRRCEATAVDLCEMEPDCKVVIDFGDHGMGGPRVCVTRCPHGQQWAQERKRRECLTTPGGVWRVYQLTDDGSVYGECEGKCR